MKIEPILYNAEKGKPQFELTEGVRPWDMLLLIAKGSITVTFPDRAESSTVGPFEIAYFPANQEFLRTVTSPIDFYQFTFRRIDTDPLYAPLRGGKLPIPPLQVQAMVESLKQLAACRDQDLPISQMIYHIITENYIFSKSAEAEVREISQDISDTIAYMHTHIREKLSIQQLGARVYLSHNGLIWKFKQEVGMPPAEYLIRIRLRRAKSLLLEHPKCPIREIAETCGYANSYYFCNAFRRYMGMSPTAFRKKYLQ